MTFTEIKSALVAAGKPVAEAQLYRYFRNFGIQQVGIRQKPRRYADDSAQIILAKLGLAAAPALGSARSRVPIPIKPAGLVKLPALKRARALAKKGAAK